MPLGRIVSRVETNDFNYASAGSHLRNCMTHDGTRFAEKTLESFVLYRGKSFTLHQHKIRLASGEEISRDVIDHPGAVGLIPMLNEDTFILIGQYRQAAGRILYEIPAGTLRRGESPEECAIRELIEETGYRPKRLKKLLQAFVAPGYSNELMYFYLATELEQIGVSPDPDETIEVHQTKIGEVLSMLRENEIEDVKSYCGILFALLDKERLRL